jgi:hypothetical protein
MDVPCPTAQEPQHLMLPVALSLDLPASAQADLLVLSIPCAAPVQENPGQLSWRDLLGDR